MKKLKFNTLCNTVRKHNISQSLHWHVKRKVSKYLHVLQVQDI